MLQGVVSTAADGWPGASGNTTCYFYYTVLADAVGTCAEAGFPGAAVRAAFTTMCNTPVVSPYN